MADLKKMYKTIMDDDFPDEMTIRFGEQTLMYRKRAWKIPDEKTGELIEKDFAMAKILISRQHFLNS